MTRRKLEVIALAVLLGVFIGRNSDLFAKLGAYPFFDTIVDVRSEIVRHYVETPDEQKMLDGSVRGMLEALNDPYTDYFPPKELEAFETQTRATFSGIGAEIDEQDGHVVIVSPLEDSPAYKAGIQAGDIILEIDGEAAPAKSAEAVKRIKGAEGSKVKLKVRHLDGNEVTLEITRQRIQIQTVRGFNRDAAHHWNYLLDTENGVGYIRLTQFSDPTADALLEAIKNAKSNGMKGLILDLRFNPGGLLDQAVDISNMFLSSGKIVSTKGRNSPERSWKADKSDDVGDFPMVVLINEFSASASEILSGALKDNDRAIVVGTRSFGKGSVQQVMALESGNGAVKVTTAYYYLPSGRNIHRREGATEWGVDPNDGYYIPMTADQMRKMNELRRSSEIIKAAAEAAEKQTITPAYIADKLSDPQLAGALEAMIAKLKTGEWKKTGKGNATLVAHVTERAELEKRRDALQESIGKVNDKLKELEAKIALLDKDTTAEAADTSKPAPVKKSPKKSAKAPAEKSTEKQGEATKK